MIRTSRNAGDHPALECSREQAPRPPGSCFPCGMFLPTQCASLLQQLSVSFGSGPAERTEIVPSVLAAVYEFLSKVAFCEMLFHVGTGL